jgi:hypothetical protein
MSEQTVWCETCGDRIIVGDWDESPDEKRRP